MVFGNGPLGGDQITRAEISRMRLVPLQKRPQKAHLLLLPFENIMKSWPFMNLEVTPHQTLNLPVP